MSDNLSLNTFSAIDRSGQASTYITALEAFDRIAGLQELKEIARAQVHPAAAVLDVGCGPGLETVSLARRAGPGARVCGLDKSADFIAEARRRSAAAGLAIDYAVADALALPWQDASFDHVRCERMLVYIDDVPRVLSEMRRVLRPGGTLVLIEPQLDSVTVNLPDRGLVRRVVTHEADTAVAQSWLPGRLPDLLAGLGLRSVAIATRVLVLPRDLAGDYFLGAAHKAADDGAISARELTSWKSGVDGLHRSDRLFGTIAYFLFACRS